MRPVDGEGCRSQGFSDQSLDRHLNSSAHGGTHLIHRGGGQPEAGHGVGMTPVNGLEVVDQGAVEVEENAGGKHGGPGASRGPPQRGEAKSAA
jgi:hypothetical protein